MTSATDPSPPRSTRPRRAGHLGLVLRVARAPELRRLVLAFAGFSLAEYATWIAILVVAFARGGVSETGVVTVVQLVPAVVVAPFAAFAGDRFRPERALAAGYAAQSLAMIGTAVAIAADRPYLAYAGAAAVAVCFTFTRPVMGSLLPNVTHAPADLVAANVLVGLVSHAGAFLGPVIAGVVLANGSPQLVYVVGAVLTSSSFTLVVRIRPSPTDADVDPVETPPRVDAGDVVAQVFAGFRALAHHASVRVLVGVLAVCGLSVGVADVLAVSLVDERLGSGQGTVGVLGAALGVGALLGSIAATALIEGAGVIRHLVISAVLLGGSLLALAAIDRLVPMVLLFAALGAGDSMAQLTASVAIQRHAPLEVLARVFGVIEGVQTGALALGSLLFAGLASALSLGRGSVVAGVGLLLLLGVITFRLRRLGGDAPRLDRAVVDRVLLDPVMSSLPSPSVERIARSVAVERIAQGARVVAEGEVGDRYYLVVSGLFEVTIDGRPIRQLGPGASFGEIALLRDVRRTATVVAAEPSELLAVPRDVFLEAVTGHPRSLGTATRVVDRFLDP